MALKHIITYHLFWNQSTNEREGRILEKSSSLSACQFDEQIPLQIVSRSRGQRGSQSDNSLEEEEPFILIRPNQEIQDKLN